MRRKLRFKLATIMIVIASLAVIVPLWNSPIDPFDPNETISPFGRNEMIGPAPTTPDRKVLRTKPEPSRQPEDSAGQNGWHREGQP